MPRPKLPARYTTSTFTPERANAVVCRLSGGRSLRAVCRDLDMPSSATVRNWMIADPAFAAQVAAVRDRAGGRRSPGGKRPSAYTDDLADYICAHLRAGRTLTDICRDGAVPVGPHAVQGWARRMPAFAERYRAACAPRPTPRGLHIGRGRRGALTPALAEALVDRLLADRPLSAVARDPDMPNVRLIGRWRARRRDFDLMLQGARRAQLDLLCARLLADADAGRRGGGVKHLIAVLTRCGYLPYGIGVRKLAEEAVEHALARRKRRPLRAGARKPNRHTHRSLPLRWGKGRGWG